MEQPADLYHFDDMPAEADDDERGADHDRGGDDDIDPDDYPIIDDDIVNGSLDDNLAAFIDDLNAVLDHFYNGGNLDDGPDDDCRGESDPAGESE